MELDQDQAMVLMGGKKEHDIQEGNSQGGKVLTTNGIKFTILRPCSKIQVIVDICKKLFPDYFRLDLENLLSQVELYPPKEIY